MKKHGSVSKPCTPVVHIKIAGKWMFIPLKMVVIGIDPYPYMYIFQPQRSIKDLLNLKVSCGFVPKQGSLFGPQKGCRV
jgi:hypothetical protein